MKNRSVKNIILCGFMASGKTTTGRILAKKMGLRLMDTDQQIEKEQDMTVSDIFQKFGEPRFRELERDLCRKLAEDDRRGLVVATGGGILTAEENRENLKKAGTVVFLDVSFDIIARRLERSHTATLAGVCTRPLAKDARELYDKRLSVYRETADMIISLKAETPDQVASKILAALRTEGLH